ncbi:MAG: tetratricopeptide repeat protein [Planctomycetota bacterium]
MKQTIKILAVTILFALFLSLTTAQQSDSHQSDEIREFDSIYVKDSLNPLIGLITKETETHVFIKLRDYNTDIETPVDKSIVERIDRRTTPKQAFSAKRKKIKSDDYEKLFELAKWSLRYPQLSEEFKNTIKETIKAKPDFLKAYLLFSDILRGKYEKSETPSTNTQIDEESAIYMRAIECGIESPTIRFRLGLIYKNLKLFDEAIKEFDAALALSDKPDFVNVERNVKLEKAELLLTSRKYAEAISVLEEVLSKTPNDVRTLTLSGKTSLRIGNYIKAEEYFHSALEIDPLYPDILIGLASTAYKQDEYKTAEEFLNMARDCSLKETEILTDLATIHIRQGKYSFAETELKEAVSKDPKYARTHLILGDLAENKGDYQTALSEYQTARSCGLDNAVLSYKLATVLYKTGNKDKAANKELQHCLSFETYSKEVFIFLSIIEYESGNLNNAVKYLNYALQISPNDANVHYLFALIHLKLGNIPQAESEIKEALKSQPGHSKSLSCLAYLAYNRGDYEKAIAFFDAAKSKDPFASYILACMEKIDTVLNQEFWKDNFSRPNSPDVSNNWIEENDARTGIEMKIESNKLVFTGTQRKEKEVISLTRIEPNEQFVKFEAQINTFLAEGARFGIFLSEPVKQNKKPHGIMLLKSENGYLSYNYTTEKREWEKPLNGHQIDIEPYPSGNEEHTLAIKLIDKNAGFFKLLLDDREIASVTNPKLADVKEFTLSIFGQSENPNVPWTVFVHSVRISKMKTK